MGRVSAVQPVEAPDTPSDRNHVLIIAMQSTSSQVAHLLFHEATGRAVHGYLFVGGEEVGKPKRKKRGQHLDACSGHARTWRAWQRR